MAFPAFAKTWTTSFNNSVTLAASATLTQQKMAHKLKDLLLTAGWTTTESSNAGVVSAVEYGGSNNGGTLPFGGTTTCNAGQGTHTLNSHFGASSWPNDKWAISGAVLTQAAGHISVANDVNPGIAGVRHSWILLSQTGGIASGSVQLLINMPASGTGIGLYFSGSAAFTGGTAIDRPTATDEITLNSGFLALTASNPARIVHLWYSSDHQCTRIMFCRGGFIEAFLLLDRARSPVTGWNNPFIGMALSSAAASPTITDFASVSAITAVSMVGTTNGASGTGFTGSTTFDAFNANAPLATAAGVGTVVNSFDGTWPVLQMGVASNAGYNNGRHGGIFDMWHAPTGITNADTAVNTGGNGVVKLGGLVLPWDGSTVVVLT